MLWYLYAETWKGKGELQMVFHVKAVLAGVLLITLTACDQSQVDDDSNQAILQELKQIRTLLERIEEKGLSASAKARAIPRTARLSTQGRPSIGKANAPITIVEVSDYQCPYCKRFVDSTYPHLKRQYIDTGKARLVFKDMPLGIHKHAVKAAQAALCAGDQGKYWEMHDILFNNTQRLDVKYLPEYANIIKLDHEKFVTCINSDQHLAAIDSDFKQASQKGLTGTPSFVIGKTTTDVISGDVIRGAKPLASFKSVIDKQLKGSKRE